MAKKFILIFIITITISMCCHHYFMNNSKSMEISSNPSTMSEEQYLLAASDYIDEQINAINLDDIKKEENLLRDEYEKNKSLLLNGSYDEFFQQNGDASISRYMNILFYLGFEKYKSETNSLIDCIGNCPYIQYGIFSPPYMTNIAYENFDKITLNHDDITQQENLLWIINILSKELDYTNKSNDITKNSDLSTICDSLAQVYFYMNDEDMAKYYNDLNTHYQELVQEDIKQYN